MDVDYFEVRLIFNQFHIKVNFNPNIQLVTRFDLNLDIRVTILETCLMLP